MNGIASRADLNGTEIADESQLQGSCAIASRRPCRRLPAGTSTPCWTPAVPAGISPTYFLELTLTRGQQTVSRNVYWLSTKPDAVDWSKTLGSGSGVTHQPNGYADLTGLQGLGPADPLERQRHHALAGREPDADRVVSGERPARSDAGGQRVGVERRIVGDRGAARLIRGIAVVPSAASTAGTRSPGGVNAASRVAAIRGAASLFLIRPAAQSSAAPWMSR